MVGRFICEVLFIVAVLTVLCGPPTVSAQIDESKVDPDLKEIIADAYEEIYRHRNSGQTAREDSARLVHALRIFDEYLQRGETESGKYAVHFSFLQWGTAGAVSEAMQAIASIDYDSNVWSFVVRPLQSAFRNSERHDIASYYTFLQSLDGKLSDHRGQAAVDLELARYEIERGDTLAAIEAYRDVVNLNADPIMVDIALGYLYEIESLGIGERAPVFEAESISGETISLNDLRGQIVLLEFWATWCGPCIPEIQYLKQTWSQSNDEDFALIGISLDTNVDDVHRFVAEEGIPWPQIVEPDAFRGEISEMYNVSGIPRTYLVDRQGTIIAKDLRKGEIVEVVREVIERSPD